MATMTVDTPGGAAPQTPADRRGDPALAEQSVGSLSPSRAADFMACPLLYRFRTVDRLPEAPSPEATRGTVVHKVLEDLFDLPPAERTHERAAMMLEPAWEDLLADEPDLLAMFDHDPTLVKQWLATCGTALQKYFELEDPSLLEPAEREVYVECLTDSKLLLRGFVDRIDVAADGSVRVVDYKTGRAPGEFFEAKALFQLKFYALVWWRTRGVIPRMLQLIYLGNGEVLRYQPDERDLVVTERKLDALWSAISRAGDTGDWRHQPSRLCSWCSHQAICPEFGGTPPPVPPAPSPQT